MGIYIPNMEKPKNCYACSFNDGIYCALIDNDTDAFIKDNPTEVATKVLDDCPLIEIDLVMCKDCKYMTEHYDTDGNAPYWICSEWDSGTDYDGFCHYGERRMIWEI